MKRLTIFELKEKLGIQESIENRLRALNALKITVKEIVLTQKQMRLLSDTTFKDADGNKIKKTLGERYTIVTAE